MGRMISGAWRFGLLGVLAFAVWMAPLKMGTTVLYVSVASVFILGSGLLLYPLFSSSNRVLSCYKIFLPGFIIYSIFWCIGWFGIGGSAGELLGSAAGLAAFVFIIRLFYFRDPSQSFLSAWSIIFLLHTLGYTIGSMFFYGTNGNGVFASFMEDQKTLGGLLWGLWYGLGFGAGLGAVLKK